MRSCKRKLSESWKAFKSKETEGPCWRYWVLPCGCKASHKMRKAMAASEWVLQAA